jgi:H+/gluconate symporter-like permease
MKKIIASLLCAFLLADTTRVYAESQKTACVQEKSQASEADKKIQEKIMVAFAAGIAFCVFGGLLIAAAFIEADKRAQKEKKKNKPQSEATSVEESASYS